jgi:hypothetical protein
VGTSLALMVCGLSVTAYAAQVPKNPKATKNAKTTKKAVSVTTPSRVSSTKPASSVVPGGLTQISVESTTKDYFVLYVRPGGPGTVELPVAVAKGQNGTTIVSDGRTQLAKDRYRVARMSVDKPGDADGDGVNDLVELADPKMNPVNPGKPVNANDGGVVIQDRTEFERLSYQGDDVLRDGYLAGREYTKFWLVGTDAAHPSVYFMNTEIHRGHFSFGPLIGFGGRGPRPGTMRGDIVYDPNATSSSGSKGTYRFAFQPEDAFSFVDIAVAFELLSSSMPFLKNNLSYHPFEGAARDYYNLEKPLYDSYRVPVVLEGS